ncbi:MAG: acyclic terpene utilization AtuA family protein [Bryobacterales bacterium]|nr:acyclic terpene utilization AtuA family protein [Bryobacterales bacterium]
MQVAGTSAGHLVECSAQCTSGNCQGGLAADSRSG